LKKSSYRLCNKQERDRKITAAKYTASVAVMLPLHSLDMTQRSGISLVANLSCFHIEEPVLLVVTPCDWVTVSRHFERTYRLNVQGYESVN